jgi:hypothetical protein
MSQVLLIRFASWLQFKFDSVSYIKLLLMELTKNNIFDVGKHACVPTDEILEELYNGSGVVIMTCPLPAVPK